MKSQESHSFEIRPRQGSGAILTGAATEILMDGVPMKGVKKVSFEVEAQHLAKLTIEIYGSFAIRGEIGSYETVIVPLGDPG